MAMGPNAVGDLAGLDIGASVRRGMARTSPTTRASTGFPTGWPSSGRFGQKTGTRFLSLRRRRAASARTIPEVAELIRAEAERLSVKQR